MAAFGTQRDANNEPTKIISLSVCGQTLNNDRLLSVWFNDEDCLAYVRDAYFLNR